MMQALPDPMLIKGDKSLYTVYKYHTDWRIKCDKTNKDLDVPSKDKEGQTLPVAIMQIFGFSAPYDTDDYLVMNIYFNATYSYVKVKVGNLRLSHSAVIMTSSKSFSYLMDGMERLNIPMPFKSVAQYQLDIEDIDKYPDGDGMYSNTFDTDFSNAKDPEDLRKMVKDRVRTNPRNKNIRQVFKGTEIDGELMAGEAQ